MRNVTDVEPDQMRLPESKAKAALRGQNVPLIIIPVVAALMGSAFFLLREHQIARTWGFSLDDAWIHAVIARNLAEGHGYSFNPGESVSGSTAPLYTLLLALFYRVTGSMVWSGKGFGILCHAATSAVLARAAFAADPRARGPALLAGILFAVSPMLLWASVSGMEIPLYLLFVTLGILLYIRGRALPAIAFWALGVWVRPDGILLVVIGCLGRRKEVIRRVGVAAPIVAAFVLFNLLVGSTALPESVLVKTRLGLTGTQDVWNVVREWGALWGIRYRSIDDPTHPFVLVPLMLWGGVLLFRRLPAVALLPFVLPLGLGIAAGSSGTHGRYLFSVIPFGILLAMAGGAELLRRVPHGRLAIPPAAAAVLLLLWQGANAFDMATLHGWNVQNVNGMQRWLGSAAERMTAPGDAIATNDIGAIGYFSHRRVVDLVGLVSPTRSLPENLRVYRPKLVIVYPSWFQASLREDPALNDIYFSDSDSLYRYSGLFGVQLLHNTVNSRSRISVFVRRRTDEPPPGQRWIYTH